MNTLQKLGICGMSVYPVYFAYEVRKDEFEKRNVPYPSIFTHINTYYISQKAAFTGKFLMDGISLMTSDIELKQRVVESLPSILIDFQFSKLLVILQEIYSNIKENSFLSLFNYTLLNVIVLTCLFCNERVFNSNAESLLKIIPFALVFNPLLIFELGYCALVPFLLAPKILMAADLCIQKADQFIGNKRLSNGLQSLGQSLVKLLTFLVNPVLKKIEVFMQTHLWPHLTKFLVFKIVIAFCWLLKFCMA